MTLRRIELKNGADLDGFRRAVRLLVAQNVAPETVTWSYGSAPSAMAGDAPPVPLPRGVGEMIELVACHRDPERYSLLYTMVWRVLRGERALLEVPSDPLVHRLERMAKTVRRELHKMHAFLRFRRVEATDGGERFVAWFEPEHHILEAVADFFVERFRGMVWSILTPLGSLHWDRERLSFGPPATRNDAPAGDGFEEGWRGYYESTFNPARTNPKLMRGHMPERYWRNMPEAQSITSLIRSAPARVEAMLAREAALPAKRNPDKAVLAMSRQDPQSLAELNRIIAAAEPLVPGATQAVLGEGPIGAAIAFVGEQPGDQEDLQARPFVGPAGQLLDETLAAVGIDRVAVYVTNAVKHFKFEQRGKKRIHQKPTTGEVKHYRWWLMKELELVQPGLVVALGATALLALSGKALPIVRNRGPMQLGDWPGYITVHPSYLLRLPDETAQRQAMREFRADLERIRDLAARNVAA